MTYTRIPKPEGGMPYRYYANRDPTVAHARKELADVYRKLHNDRPDLARLVYKRAEAARAELNKRIVNALFTS